MDEHEFLSEGFEANRAHLRAVAYRMLGSRSEADDAVQEAWLRVARADAGGITNLGGWLTTIVARVCLDMLRTRKSRAVLRRDDSPLEPSTDPEHARDPEHELLLADSASLALLVVLETLSPPERVAFVLHDVFDLPFDDIAPIVSRTPAAARQLASRARRRVQGTGATTVDHARQRELVEAFSIAARSRDFTALLALLDPDVVVRADPMAVRMGASAELRGSQAVVDGFKGGGRGARLALIDGALGLAWAPRNRLRVAIEFTIVGDRIAAIDLIADAESLAQLDVVILDG